MLSNPRRRLQGRQVVDPVHINAIEPRGADEVAISTRHTDAVYEIRRSSGEIAWKLGGSKTADSLRIVGDPARKVEATIRFSPHSTRTGKSPFASSWSPPLFAPCRLPGAVTLAQLDRGREAMEDVPGLDGAGVSR